MTATGFQKRILCRKYANTSNSRQCCICQIFTWGGANPLTPSSNTALFGGKCPNLGGRDYRVLGVTTDNGCLYSLFVTSKSAYPPSTFARHGHYILLPGIYSQNNPLTPTRRNYKTEVCIFAISRQWTRRQSGTLIAPSLFMLRFPQRKHAVVASLLMYCACEVVDGWAVRPVNSQM